MNYRSEFFTFLSNWQWPRQISLNNVITAWQTAQAVKDVTHSQQQPQRPLKYLIKAVDMVQWRHHKLLLNPSIWWHRQMVCIFRLENIAIFLLIFSIGIPVRFSSIWSYSPTRPIQRCTPANCWPRNASAKRNGRWNYCNLLSATSTASPNCAIISSPTNTSSSTQ